MWVTVALLSGYSNIDAHVNSYTFSSSQNSEKQELSGPEELHTSLQIINDNFNSTLKSDNALSFKQNDKTELTDNENEEEEASLKLAPLKKLNGLSNYHSFTFYTKAPAYFCDIIKVSLPVCKHIFNFPSQKLNVLFRVFRI